MLTKILIIYSEGGLLKLCGYTGAQKLQQSKAHAHTLMHLHVPMKRQIQGNKQVLHATCFAHFKGQQQDEGSSASSAV